MIKALGYIASFNTILSVYLTGNKHISIWYISIANQCIWAFIGWKTNQYYLIWMAVGLQVLNVRGLRKWRRENQYLKFTWKESPKLDYPFKPMHPKDCHTINDYLAKESKKETMKKKLKIIKYFPPSGARHRKLFNTYLMGITVKATDKFPKYTFKVPRAKVQDFIDGVWRYPRNRRPASWRDNPASIMKELLIKADIYPKEDEQKWIWDKIMGNLYLYANKKIDGFTIENMEKIKCPR